MVACAQSLPAGPLRWAPPVVCFVLGGEVSVRSSRDAEDRMRTGVTGYGRAQCLYFPTGWQPARWCAVRPDQQRSAVGDAHRAGGHRVESVDGKRRQARRRGGRRVPAEPSRPGEQRQPWSEQVEGGDACGRQPQVRDAPAEVGGQFLVHAAPGAGRVGRPGHVVLRDGRRSAS